MTNQRIIRVSHFSKYTILVKLVELFLFRTEKYYIKDIIHDPNANAYASLLSNP